MRTFPPIVERNHSLLSAGPVGDLARAIRRHARADRVDRLVLKGLLRTETQALLGAWRAPGSCSVLKLNDALGTGRPAACSSGGPAAGAS